VKEALKLLGVEDFFKSFQEDSKVLIVLRGGNQVGRFLEVASSAVGGQKGFIWLPKGREGWGVGGELRVSLARWWRF
jgi:hypothetical protein